MDRFFDKIYKSEDGCWYWTGALRNNYGAIKIKHKVIDAHRVSWILHNGNIPKGLYVCHTCDNPMCVNPNHLFLGTNSDNMKDCYKKGRMVLPIASRRKKGCIPFNLSTDLNTCKLVKDAVLNRGNTRLISIAERFGVSYQFVRDVSCGRILNNITPSMEVNPSP